MASHVRPLSAVDPRQIVDFLCAQGMSQNIVRWKYFDRPPVSGEEHGQIVIKDGQVVGFIGLNPFTTPNGLRAAWTCDWFAEGAGGGSGIALLSACMRAYDALYQLGGNERTQAILAKLAQRSIPGAGIEYYLPLRLGSYLRPLARRSGVPVDRVLGRIPLPRRRGRNSDGSVRAGIAPEVAGLLAAGSPTSPNYSLEYVDWQIGRCPVLSTSTCLLPGESGAAILLWTTPAGGKFWRMAPIWKEGASPGLEAALGPAIRHVYDSGGSRLSLFVSHRDE